MLEQDAGFLIETWSLFALGVIILLGRFGTRIRTVGFKGFQGDDYFAIGVLIFFTLDALLVHIIYFIGTNSDYTKQEIDAFSPHKLDRVAYAGKLQLTAWYSYTALIWCLKGTMCVFFHRLTFATWQQRLVEWIGASCVVSYIAVFITLTAGCRPYSGNWQVDPLPSVECTAKKQNFLVVGVLNVLTDAALLSIPIPLLWKLRVPIKQKIVIAVLLSLGLFVIIATILRVIFSTVPNPSVLTINSWGVRETIVGIISVNMPILRPVFRREFWSANRSLPSSASKHTGNHYALSTLRQKKAERIPDDNDSRDFICHNKKNVMVETTIEIRHSNNNDLEAGAGSSSTKAGSTDWKFGENGVEARGGV